jgi:hypothetical protein
MTRKAGVPIATSLLALLLMSACTGGSESKAAGEETPGREAPAAQTAVDARKEIADISPAIPLYQGAQYRDDLTRRDQVMIRSKYGNGAQVYTLATDDSYPQVYHYYTTYLAQFRAYGEEDRLPSERQEWRTYEVPLNQAMQDPFIPGEALSLQGKQVTLQIAETEAEPRTVIRYIVTPAGTAPPPAVASVSPTAAAAPVAR